MKFEIGDNVMYVGFKNKLKKDKIYIIKRCALTDQPDSINSTEIYYVENDGNSCQGYEFISLINARKLKLEKINEIRL